MQARMTSTTMNFHHEAANSANYPSSSASGHSMFPMRPVAALGMCILLALAACRDASDQPPAGGQAGDRPFIVQSVVGAMPDLQLGLSGSEAGDTNQLFRVVGGAVQLSSGNIAVLDSRDRRVRFFDPKGKFLRSFGRSGQGPEEFGSPAIVPLVRYDSLVITDARNRRVTVLSLEGALKSSQSLTTSLGTPVGTGSDGRVLQLNVSFRGSSAGGMGFNPVALSLLNPASSVVDTLQRDSIPWVRARGKDGQVNSIDAPFRVYPSAAAARDRFFITSGPALDIRVYQSGRFTKTLTVASLIRDLPSHTVDSVAAPFIAASSDPAAVRQYFADLPVVTKYPVWRKLLVDETGNLWAQLFVSSGAYDGMWHVFTPDLAQLGTLKLPDGLEVTQVGQGFILGIWRDQDNVNYVRRYSLNRRLLK